MTAEPLDDVADSVYEAAIEHHANIAYNTVKLYFQEHPEANPFRVDIKTIVTERS